MTMATGLLSGEIQSENISSPAFPNAGAGTAINDLIQTCIDGQKCFEAAAKSVDDPTIKDELVGYSWQRQQFATELRSHMKALGQDASDHGTLGAVMQRGWMDLKSAFGGISGHGVLVECERGEDRASAAYRQAMEEGVPAEFMKVVASQYQTIQRTHDRIKALRDSTHRAN